MKSLRETVETLERVSAPLQAAAQPSDSKENFRGYETRLAQSPEDLASAQRLRYAVFVEELGAAAGPLCCTDQRLERDEFDAVCDHLILVDPRIDPATLTHVQGVYRVLSGEAAAGFGRFYCDAEYDLSALKASGRKLLELGRSCVAPQLRGGSALMLLWAALSEYIAERGVEFLFGAASFHGTDPRALAEPLAWLHHHHRAPETLCAKVLQGVDMALIAPDRLERARAMAQMPALIRAYLRAGGMVGEGAYVDHEFNTTDVLVMLDCAQMSARHRAYFERKGRAA